MYCPKCGTRNGEGQSFCRHCGTDIESLPPERAARNLPSMSGGGEGRAAARSKDPDELVSNGIGGVIMGDGFFLVAVILSATNSAVGSLLWLFLLIPAFYYFGRGFADILHAKQILRRRKLAELGEAATSAALPPPQTSVADVFRKSITGEFAAAPGLTERTTRDLA